MLKIGGLELPARGSEAEKKRLSQMGLMTAAAIAIHNFPEGLATFLSTVSDVRRVALPTLLCSERGCSLTPSTR